MIGNVAGEFVYELCKREGTKKSQQMIAGYRQEMEQLERDLDIKYQQVVAEVRRALQKFKDLEDLAFNENVNIAFSGSVDLALEAGVDKNRILRTEEQINDYFLA